MGTVDSQQDFQEIPLLKIVPEQLASDPSPTQEGRLWTNTAGHVLKTWLNGVIKTLITSDDSRLTDSRTPSGSAGGDLTGSYPNPVVGNGAIGVAKLNTSVKSGAEGGSAAPADPAIRSLGFDSWQALQGTAKLNQLSPPNGNVNFNSQRLTSLQDPTSLQDAATKAYVDSVAQGLSPKIAVRVASTANIPVMSSTLTIDGVATAAGERVLVKNNTAASENGIWVVSAGAWTRALDMDNWSEVPGSFVFVQEGTTQADTGWVVTSNAGGTIGSTDITWSQFSSAGSYTAGLGLSLTGLDFSVNLDNASLESVSDIIQVKSLGITNAKIANGTIDLVNKVTGSLPIANGGTAASTAAGARTNLGAVGKNSINSPALTAGTWSSNIAHNLGTTDVMVQITDSVGVPVVLDWKIVDSNNIAIKTDVPGGRAASYYRVRVFG